MSDKNSFSIVRGPWNMDLNYMESFLPSTTFSRPVDMTFGSDGALYLLEYGNAWNTRNEDAQLSRIQYSN